MEVRLAAKAYDEQVKNEEAFQWRRRACQWSIQKGGAMVKQGLVCRKLIAIRLSLTACVLLVMAAVPIQAQVKRANPSTGRGPSLRVGMVEVWIGQAESELRRSLNEHYDIVEAEVGADTVYLQIEERGQSWRNGYPIVGSVWLTKGRVSSVSKEFAQERYGADDYVLLLERAFLALDAVAASNACGVQQSRVRGTRRVLIFHRCGRYTLTLSVDSEEKTRPKLSASLSVE